MPKKISSKKKTTKSPGKKKSVEKKSVAKSIKTVKAKDVGKKFSAKKIKMIKDIILLLDELDEKNLEFLVNQCGVMYNNQKIRSSYKKKLKSRADVPGQKNKAGKSQVKIREADDDSYFIIEINNYSNFFTLKEMRKLVTMCHASDDEIDASNRIFKWFSNERQDVRRNSLLNSPGDKSLQEVYNIIISTYSVKE